MNIRTAASPMIAVPIQPKMTMCRLDVNAPITDFLEATRMITTIKGTATMPLIRALRNSAFIEPVGAYWITNPASTLTAITP